MRSVATQFVSAQEFVLVQKFDYVQWRESGFSSHNEFVLLAGAKAKTVTSNLPLLSVLGEAVFYFLSWSKNSNL